MSCSIRAQGSPSRLTAALASGSVSLCLVQPSLHRVSTAQRRQAGIPLGAEPLTAPVLSGDPKSLTGSFRLLPSSPPTHPPCHAPLTGVSPSPVLCPQWTDPSPSAQNSASSSESVPSPTPCTPPLGSQLAPFLSGLCSALHYCHLPPSCKLPGDGGHLSHRHPSATAPLHTQ